jgi:tripartite-type tricarboxylate transporter receptor subunit TctC
MPTRGDVPGSTAGASRRNWAGALARVIIAACAATPAGLLAQERFPAKAVRLIVPFPAGGSTDLVARSLGQRLAETWAQPVIVENRAGAGGTIASEAVARAAPDGHLLLIGSVSTHAIVPQLMKKPPYDPVADFTPISELASFPNVLAVNAALPVRSVRELVALARQRPGQLTFASNGNGTSNHLAGELLKVQAGIDLLHVPYKGGAPAIADTVAGHVAMLFNGVSNVLPYHRAGKLRALAVAGPGRSASLPEVPTMREAGLPGVESVVWLGLFAPPALPGEILTRIHADTVAGMRHPKVAELLTAQGAEVVAGSPKELAARIREDLVRWRKVIEVARVPAE